ncbi:Alpha-1,6-mannosyl-glycoprotein 2-beta-N-acetylglucosaminyltransferase [Aphelenchoides besseyi]|nr:Alpha-1,6-mannosyl-glycoprotein 2-beta-N-acetylglucosaminyltransferase [Aphelenchoides besseyi]
MFRSRRLNRLFKFAFIVSTLVLLYKIIPNSENDGVPQFENEKKDFNLQSLWPNVTPVPFKFEQNAAPVLNLSGDFRFTSPVEQKTIVDSLKFLNAQHKIQNEDVYGKLNSETVSAVIVVQVHNRLEYLKYLIGTLENARGVNRTLLVFSHDISSFEINQVIQNITFCRVIQIFYPHNIQLFPNVFPGQDPNDCPERISTAEASQRNCNNHAHPDKYGHYRVAQLTQIKHHWWWKMNYVFDGIVDRYGLDEKYVLLLEEDHYVSPDSLYMLDVMIRNKTKLVRITNVLDNFFSFCPDCDVLCLGFYLKSYKAFPNDIHKLSIQAWFSSKHNMGMAINKATWSKIRNCSTLFCSYDDYNWDWSLLHISLKCMQPRMRVLLTKAPRVIHVGDCGVHTHRCQVHNAAANARTLFETHQSLLFPSNVERTEVSKRSLKPSKPNGGWGDVRDHQLCMNNTTPYKPEDSRIIV